MVQMCDCGNSERLPACDRNSCSQHPKRERCECTSGHLSWEGEHATYNDIEGTTRCRNCQLPVGVIEETKEQGEEDDD